jgi:cytochrome c oxidase assembly protein subunit 15
MTVDDFKKIYMWEWSHRIIGRVIGVAFAVPAVYFLSRGYMARGNRWKLVAIGLGIGFQGALGWFMVQSGLKAPEQTPPAIAPQHPNSTASTSVRDMPLDGAVTNILDGPSTSSEWHPRVSHFRLAAHLGTAFLVYLGMLHTGLAIVRDNRLVKGSGNAGGWSMSVPSNAAKLVTALTSDNRVARLRNVSRAMFVLTFATAMTGALVAGLDAGLVYSEFPYMGEGFIPPTDELLDERYAPNRKDRRQLIIGNATQNPVTVQLIHRCMAVTTLASAVGLAFYARRVSSSMLRTAGRTQSGGITLPPSVPRLATLVAAAAVGQATLGISTLIYLVPIELASAHQAGSVALLSAVVALLASLRRPNSRVLRLLTQKHAISSSTAKEVHRQATVERALSRVVKASS